MSRERVAVIPVVCRGKGKRRLILITKRRHGDWIVPCGKKEAKLSDKRVAALEAYEEAGVVGKLERLDAIKGLKIRSYKGKPRKLKLYGLRVRKKLNHWPEEHQRRRRSIKPAELKYWVQDKPLRKAIEQYLSQL